MVLTLAFWRAAGLRALYTVLAAALPLLAPLVGEGWAQTREALLGLLLAAVASLATSIAHLPELGNGRNRWTAILDRVLRTFGQVLAAALTAALTLDDVHWPTLLVQAATAAGTTLLRAIIDELPEAPTIVEAPTADGAHLVTDLPQRPFDVGDRVRIVAGLLLGRTGTILYTLSDGRYAIDTTGRGEATTIAAAGDLELADVDR